MQPDRAGQGIYYLAELLGKHAQVTLKGVLNDEYKL